jgi:putative transposase
MHARPVYPGDTHFITRRCQGRLARLRPGEEVKRVVIYCLARAARRHKIEVIAFTIMSTHLHIVLRDPKGNLPRFCHEFFPNVARALNFEQETGGIVFEPGSYRRQTLATPKAIYKEIAYTIANPVAASLVSEPSRWPGLITLAKDLGRRTFSARRPRFFRAPEGEVEGALTGDETVHGGEPAGEPEPMREEESLTLTLPALLPDGTESRGRGDEVRRAAADWLTRELEKVHEERRKAGIRGWLGVDKVKAQSPKEPPCEVDLKPTGGLNPQFATQDRKAGQEQALALYAWRKRYTDARKRWSSGDRKVIFPYGTWLAPRVWGAKAETKAG